MNKLLLYIITSVFLITFNFTESEQIGDQQSRMALPKNEYAVIKTVGKILQATPQFKKGELFPGYDLTSSPIIISFNSGHLYAFNFAGRHPIWQPRQIDGFNVLFSDKDIWGISESAFNPSFPLDEQSVYTFNLDKPKKEMVKTYQIFIHERFHRFQFEAFNLNESKGYYVDHLNSENLSLAKLEELALKAFSQGRDRASKLDALKDFAAVNQVRRSLLHYSSLLWEDHQQKMEGLADYVSFKIFDLIPLFVGYNGIDFVANGLERELNSTNYTERAIKWRHYTIGSALGYALDFLRVPNWKQQIKNGQASLTEILQQALSLPTDEIYTRFTKMQASQSWLDYSKKTSEAVASFQSEVQAIVSSFEQMQGIPLEIGRPKISLSGSGSNQRLIYLSDGSTLSLKDSLVTITSDRHWKLELSSMPYIFKKGDGSLEFKVEDGLDFILDEKSYPATNLIQAKEQKSFQKIEFKGSNSHFVSDKHPGMLSINEQGKILITFN